MIKPENLKHFIWIEKGVQRKAVLKALSAKMTPSLIRKVSQKFNEKISLSNTSDILKCLVNRGLAVCLNSEEKRGRLYELTETGKEVRENLLEAESLLNQ